MHDGLIVPRSQVDLAKSVLSDEFRRVIGVAPTPDQLRTLDVPETVVLNFAKVCNLWCQHCLFPSMARQREQHPEQQPTLFLPEDTLRAVVDEVRDWPRPPVLRIAADGEPLIHPAAVEMIRYAKARDLTVSLTTNGILLTDKLTAALLDCGIDVIDVSIDAATDNTVISHRPSANGPIDC